jgi:hypothetical protein
MLKQVRGSGYTHPPQHALLTPLSCGCPRPSQYGPVPMTTDGPRPAPTSQEVAFINTRAVNTRSETTHGRGSSSSVSSRNKGGAPGGKGGAKKRARPPAGSPARTNTPKKGRKSAPPKSPEIIEVDDDDDDDDPIQEETPGKRKRGAERSLGSKVFGRSGDDEIENSEDERFSGKSKGKKGSMASPQQVGALVAYFHVFTV